MSYTGEYRAACKALKRLKELYEKEIYEKDQDPKRIAELKRQIEDAEDEIRACRALMKED